MIFACNGDLRFRCNKNTWSANCLGISYSVVFNKRKQSKFFSCVIRYDSIVLVARIGLANCELERKLLCMLPPKQIPRASQNVETPGFAINGHIIYLASKTICKQMNIWTVNKLLNLPKERAGTNAAVAAVKKDVAKSFTSVL